MAVGFSLLLCLLSVTTAFSQRPPAIGEDSAEPIVDSIKLEKTNVEFLISEAMHFVAIENLPKALEKFLKAHQLMPSNAAVNSRIAQIYQEEQSLEKAQFYANLAYNEAPENYFYGALLANILTEQGDLNGAIDTFESLYENNPEAPDDYLLELAALYLYNGDSKKALKTYDRIEERLGVLEEVSVQKQKILLQENDLKGALKEGDKLVKAFPYIGNYAVDQAQMLSSNGKSEEAIAYLENYLSQYPNQPKVHLKLAEIFQQDGEIQKVRPHLEKAFLSEEISLRDKLNSFVPLMKTVSDSTLLKALGEILIKVHPNEANAFAANGDMYFSIGNTNQALVNYRKAVGYNASNLQLWQNILNLELELQNYQSVAQYAEEAISYYPNQSVLYLYAGSAYFSLKEYDKAIRNWKQGESITFGNDALKSTFNAQMADAYHAQGNKEESFELYQKAIQQNPNNYFAINNYVYYLSLEKRDLDNAKRLGKRMVEQNPNNGTFLDTYGWVLFQLKEYDKALDILEKAAELSPSLTILEHFGDALYQSGAKEKAVNLWKRAAEKGEASKLLKKKIEEKKYYE